LCQSKGELAQEYRDSVSQGKTLVIGYIRCNSTVNKGDNERYVTVQQFDIELKLTPKLKAGRQVEYQR